jgi:hypothetical protein
VEMPSTIVITYQRYPHTRDDAEPVNEDTAQDWTDDDRQPLNDGLFVATR